MDKSDIERMQRRLSKTPEFQKWEKLFKTNTDFQLPLKELMEEIQTYHTIRKTRTLMRGANFLNDLIDGMIDDGAKRARLVEIKMAVLRASRRIDNVLDDLEGNFLHNHSDILNTIRTKTERSSFIRSVIFSSFRKYVNRLNMVNEAADLVITDIDKFAYTYRNLVETAKLTQAKVDVHV